MRCFYTDQFVLPLPDGHRFPMRKYALLRSVLLSDGIVDEANCVPALPASEAEILAVHCRKYYERVRTGRLSAKETRRLGFPWSPALFSRSMHVSGASIQACEAALRDGMGVNLAGGTHHASFDRGQGYCVFNDSVVAAIAMRAKGLVERILILDCDVHQGNGTAALCRDESDIFTFSIHNEKAFPLHKEESDLDVCVPPGTGDEVYLKALEVGLEEAFARCDAELVIYLCGVDPYEDDRLGGLAVTRAGLAARDHMVLSQCRERGLPVALAMSGGYAHRVEDIASLHAQTIAIARSLLCSF